MYSWEYSQQEIYPILNYYSLLLYKLECFIAISTTEKKRISTREKLS